MKKTLRILLVAVAVALGLLIWTFLPIRLDVPDGDVPSPPAASPPPELEIRLLRTGSISGRHFLSVRGGSFKTFDSAVIAVLVRHPAGTYLIDAGFGRDVEEHFTTASRLMQLLIEVTLETPIADHLQALGLGPSDLDGVILTHAHWDHTSGLDDLPGVPVLLPAEEIAAIDPDDPNSALTAELRDRLDLRPLELTGGPYHGFESSHDVFGDGSMVAVAMGGHTPGSLGVFVNLATGERYFFGGDVSWTREGFEWPAEKPWISRRTVDQDPELVRRRLVQVHRMMAHDPNLIVVPAHDERVHRRVMEELGL